MILLDFLAGVSTIWIPAADGCFDRLLSSRDVALSMGLGGSLLGAQRGSADPILWSAD
ncbi:hypothetical protein DESC_720136 [Desulfosarcina cetonica]|nr:hypothetical protein DESC_720136 [Desulfosarcina cetonica]